MWRLCVLPVLALVAASLLTVPATTSANAGPDTATKPAQADTPRGDPRLPGGQATAHITGRNAFSLPSANLSPTRKVDFSVGNSFFRNPWIAAPASTTARDGLGPLFNTNTCQSCHIKDGRGHPPEHPQDDAVSMLVRLSIPASGEEQDREQQWLRKEGNIPEPVYGGQLQDMALPGIRPEGRIKITYSESAVVLADKHTVSLRKPALEIVEPGYGPMHPAVMMSARIAPPVIGLGLLEAIPEASLLANEDPDDRNGDGISGRANRVWDKVTQSDAVGRFGWKAGVPSVDQQNANAFAGDLGLTSRHNHSDDCTAAQRDCQAAPNGNEASGYEVSDEILANVLFYTRNLAVPARRNSDDPDVVRGEKIFLDSGCAGCHTPSFTTRADAAEPELASQVIYPYTDLLLHDMGEGLADHRPEFLASGREWRTPPLWGIGLTEDVNGHTFFLHDGRARNLLEAIVWHGGEAQAARDKVVALSTDDRNALLKFINSL